MSIQDADLLASLELYHYPDTDDKPYAVYNRVIDDGTISQKRICVGTGYSVMGALADAGLKLPFNSLDVPDEVESP